MSTNVITLEKPAAEKIVDRSKTRRRDHDNGWLFALPHLVLFAGFVVLPLVVGFYISLHHWTILQKFHPFIGLSNYRSALSDDIFWLALRNTVYFVILVVPASNLVSLLLALGLWKTRAFGAFYKAAFYTPVVVSIAVVAVLWQWLYDTQAGLINLVIQSWCTDLNRLGFHLPSFNGFPWLSDPHWIMPSLAVMSLWWGAGGNMIIYLAGLNNIPPDYYEAARIDGASSWQSFRAITWPLLRPTTLFCFIFSVIGAFQIFGQSYVLFGDGGGAGRAAMTLAVYMYQQGFSEFEIGYGNAVAYLLFLILMIVSAVQFGLLSRRGDQ